MYNNKFLFSIIVFLIWNCIISGVLSLNESFERASILYGISVQAFDQIKNNQSKSECYQQLTEFYEAADLKRVWTLKMMDISGRPSQGFLGGNNGWTGQSTVCADLTNRDPPEVYRAKVVQLVTEYDYPPYELGFVTAFMRHDNQLQLKTNTPMQNLIQLGLCTPQSCTGEDIQPLLERFFQKRVLTFQKLYDTNFIIEKMKTVDPTSAWLTESGRNLTILFILIGVIVVIAAISYYDLHIYQSKTKKLNGAANNDCDDDFVVIDELRSINKFDRFVLCFSWNKTYRLLLTSEVPPEIGAINGLMFFGMVFMAVYNYLIYGSTYMKHLPMEFRKYETFFGQIVANSSFAVDTVLFLSGCLVSYNFYKTRREVLLKSGFLSRISEFFILVIERIFRTLPVYVMWLLWSIYIFSYLEARWPAPLVEHPQETCPNFWWRNIFYVNNLFPITGADTCMSWTWLIAADMQYYIVNVFLLVLSTFCMKLSVTLTISMIIYCIYSTGMSAYSIDYIHTIDQQMRRNEALYHLPWHRIGSYAVGMLTGLILFKLDGKLPLKKRIIWLCWTIAPMINFYLIFGLTGQKPSIEYSTIYIAFGRVAWAAGLAWILVACSTGNAGYINSILSYPGFKMFHRLSYSSYILMVLTIIFISATFETTIYFSTISYVSQVLSVALFPYLVNCIFSMHYEIPFELLWKSFIRK